MCSLFLVGSLLAAGLFAAAVTAAETPAPTESEDIPVASARVVFSPEESAQTALIKRIDAARIRVRVSAFHFSNTHIADALIRAQARGVDTIVILDSSHFTHKRSVGPRLIAGGVRTVIDDAHKTAHNKVTLIDGRWVLTGSYNYNWNAERRNAENLLILDSPELAKHYEANWDAHYAHTVPFKRITE